MAVVSRLTGAALPPLALGLSGIRPIVRDGATVTAPVEKAHRWQTGRTVTPLYSALSGTWVFLVRPALPDRARCDDFYGAASAVRHR